MLDVVNIAAYRFTPLEALPDLQISLRDRGLELDLRGTILLAPEGINLFLAGSPAAVTGILERIRSIPGLEDLTTKESRSRRQPFRKLLVKIKKEIITFGRPEVTPACYTSTRIRPSELKQWLDEGRQFTLLDTRNDYETVIGTFENALAPPLNGFSSFPQVVEQLPAELRQKPVVTFCTGGIRCEKAAPWLELAGFQQVYQLDGGILNYFEECGGAHFQGNCFVFDERTAVRPDLTPVRDEPVAMPPESSPPASP